ncbi:MAG: hypothetical protein H5T84_01710 [Thermoleophilia bacterium]|nr:hypothetical protein [Thermoleophilia bacterium]
MPLTGTLGKSEAVRLYYAMAGWDEKTGIPTAAKLQELGLEDYLALVNTGANAGA